MTGLVLFRTICHRELLIQARQLRYVINSCLFFLMVLFLFPLTMPADTKLLRIIAPGLIWIALLLSQLLSAERLFQQDYDQGVMEQWLVSGLSLPILINGKIFAHWLFQWIPIMLLCPLVGLLFAFSPREVGILALSLICATPALLYLCALAAAFAVGLNQKGALMALIVLPLTLPILIFASGTVSLALQGFPVSGYLALLLAMSVLAVGLLPYAIAAIIRISHVD